MKEILMELCLLYHHKTLTEQQLRSITDEKLFQKVAKTYKKEDLLFENKLNEVLKKLQNN